MGAEVGAEVGAEAEDKSLAAVHGRPDDPRAGAVAPECSWNIGVKRNFGGEAETEALLEVGAAEAETESESEAVVRCRDRDLGGSRGPVLTSTTARWAAIATFLTTRAPIRTPEVAERRDPGEWHCGRSFQRERAQ